jgi:septal ring factor EnvC (AmiA/AmiB activator)
MPSGLLLAAVAALGLEAGDVADEEARRYAVIAARVAEREQRLRDRVAGLYRMRRGGLPLALAADTDRDGAAARFAMWLRVVRRDAYELRELTRERDELHRRLGGADSARRPPDPSASALEPLRGRLRRPLRGDAPVATLGGLTFRARGGRDVAAVAAGRVVFAAPFEGFERLVMVDHGGGDTSLYARLADLAVAEGDAVRAGQVLGRVARGGSLYFELRRGSDLLPAARWLR